jgi:hypothetical protein
MSVLAVRFLVLLPSLMLLLLAGPPPAEAACGNRPGTPDAITVKAISPTEIEYTWRNTTNKGANQPGTVGTTDQPHEMWFDIEVRDSAGNQVGQDITGGAHKPNLVYGIFTSQRFSGLNGGVTYCFRIRARTQGGTQGCVSQNWSNRDCAKTPLLAGSMEGVDLPGSDIRNFMTRNEGICRQACAADEGCRAWTWVRNGSMCWLKNAVPAAVRSECCVSGVMSGEMPASGTAGGGESQGGGTAEAPPPLPPRQCSVNVVLRFQACAEFPNFVPIEQEGCGTSEDEAVGYAKIAFASTQGRPNDDEGEEPEPGRCAWTKEHVYMSACTCTFPLPLAQLEQVGGQMKPIPKKPIKPMRPLTKEECYAEGSLWVAEKEKCIGKALLTALRTVCVRKGAEYRFDPQTAECIGPQEEGQQREKPVKGMTNGKLVSVEQSVDVCSNAAGCDENTRIAVLETGTQSVLLLGSCADNWCHVKWPAGEGWVYDGPDYDSLRY